MKFYLAASYGRKAELRRYRDELISLGHDCTSSWLDVPDEVTDFAFDNHAQKYAVTDLQDISHADALIMLSDGANARGGRHFECGWAYAHFMPILIVGPPELIFHSLQRVTIFESWQVLIENLDQTMSIISEYWSHIRWADK